MFADVIQVNPRNSKDTTKMLTIDYSVIKGGVGNYHDIALLKMSSPIAFDNPAVGPACLPNQGEDYEGLFWCYAICFLAY